MSDPSETHSTDESRDDARFGLILNDFLDRRARGEAVSEEEVCAAHPEFADELREALEVVGELRPSSTDIQDLLVRGVLAPCPDPAYLAQLGSYRITKLVGRGGMGVVLEAHEESLDRTVALKVLRPDLAQDKTALRRFTQEARAAAALRHPNIVTVYAVGEEHGTHFIAMELIEGPSLADVIREQGPLPTPMTREVFEQLMAGLAVAHEAGLIHRDIKPSNILLDRFSPTRQAEAVGGVCSPPATRGVAGGVGAAPGSPPLQGSAGGGSAPDAQGNATFTVKITDFGLARMLSAQTRMTLPDSVLGTPEYMSPEQARGDENIDHRTDLYSAGVVLYEMLTGRTPFKADTPSAVIHQILHEEPQDPRKLNVRADSQLAGVAMQLMSRQSDERCGFRAATVHTVHNLKTREVTKRTRTWAELRRRLLFVVVAVVLTCMGAWLLAVLKDNPRIYDVTIDEDTPTLVKVKHVGDNGWKEIHRFSPKAESVMAAERVDPDGVPDSGDEIIAVGTAMPEDGCNLFTFNAQGEREWCTYLSSDRWWPDCGSPREWSCEHIVPRDVDGTPGDELVVVATDYMEYPTQIAVIDSRSGKVMSRFWNLGNVSKILVEPDYFGRGQPAIISWGCNNKLDGFGNPPPRPYEPTPGEDEPETDHDIVSVIMVLDPRRMDHAISPPRTPRYPVPADRAPYAYAMLDLPHGTAGPHRLQVEGQAAVPANEETAQFKVVRSLPRSLTGDSDLWLECGVGGQESPEGLSRPGALITVDRDLTFLKATPASYERVGATEAYWRQAWRPLIQNYTRYNSGGGK